MPEKHIHDFVDGCESCKIYEEKYFKKVHTALSIGTISIGDELIEWILIESKAKAVKKHFIFTTLSHHIGSERFMVRSALNAKATEIAAFIFGPDYRLINNSGKASSMDHYHCHIIVPGEGERLPRAVANVQKVIKELNAPEEVKKELDKALLQQK